MTENNKDAAKNKYYDLSLKIAQPYSRAVESNCDSALRCYLELSIMYLVLRSEF